MDSVKVQTDDLDIDELKEELKSNREKYGMKLFGHKQTFANTYNA